jgi:hypothetical protein
MIYVVQEFLELLYWKLGEVLDQEGIAMLQWAFIGPLTGVIESHLATSSK